MLLGCHGNGNFIVLLILNHTVYSKISGRVESQYLEENRRKSTSVDVMFKCQESERARCCRSPRFGSNPATKWARACRISAKHAFFQCRVWGT